MSDPKKPRNDSSRYQHFTDLHLFLTGPIWEILNNRLLPIEDKCALVLDHILNLGCVNLEQKLFTEVLALGCLTAEPHEYTADVGLRLINKIKETYRMKRVDRIHSGVTHYPRTPAALKIAYPRIYDKAYTGIGPCACMVKPKVLVDIRTDIPSRKTHASIKANARKPLKLEFPIAGSPQRSQSAWHPNGGLSMSMLQQAANAASFLFARRDASSEL